MKITPFLSSKKFGYLTFFVILFFAIFLRFQGVITNSFPFTYDIGRDLITAREIATLQKIPLIGQTTGLPGLFYGPSWHYILAFFYHPLQGDPQFFTGLINATGVIMVSLAYFLGKKIGGTVLAISWSGLLAVSPAVIALTSQIWNPDLIPIFWIGTYISLYFIYKNRKPQLNFFVLGVLMALIIDMEIVVGLLYAAGIFLSVIILGKKFFSIKKVLLCVLGFLIIMSPRFIFDFRHDNVLSRTLINGLLQMFVRGGDGSPTTPFSQKALAIFSIWNETFTSGNVILGGIMLATVLLLTIILFRKTNSTIKFFLTTTIVTISISIIGLFLFGHEIWNHYLVMFPVLFVTWLAVVITMVGSVKKYRISALLFAFILIVLNINLPQQYKNLTTPLWEGDAAVYRNQVKVVDYIYEKANKNPFKFIVYTPPVHDYTYEYLFNWYGPKKYGYTPNESSKLFFVILEPDNEQPQRLKDWLKVRENDGETIEVSKVTGGIVVQTRKVQ